MTGHGDDPARDVERDGHEVARGTSARTPFLVLGGVALTVWLVAGVVIAVVLVLWLVL